MIDIEPGILLPKDIRIAEYCPQRIYDVIEVLVRDNLPVTDYIKNEYIDYINHMAIKYDKPTYMCSFLPYELMPMIFKYRAVLCLGILMARNIDMCTHAFWRHFTDQKELFDVYIRYNTHLDLDWMMYRARSKEKIPISQLRNVIKWSSFDIIMKNICVLTICRDIVLEEHPIHLFVRELIESPNQLLDVCIYDIYKDKENDLRDIVSECLKDNMCLSLAMENVRNKYSSQIDKTCIYEYLLDI